MLSLVVFCKMRPAFLPITHQKNFSLEFQGNDLVIPELLLNNTRWKPQFISFWFPEAELRACANAVSFICPQLRESKDECCGPIGRICKHKQQQTAGIFQVNDEDLNGRPLNLHFAVFDWCALFRRMKHLSPVSLFFSCRTVVESNVAIAKTILSSNKNPGGVNRFRSRTRR